MLKISPWRCPDAAVDGWTGSPRRSKEADKNPQRTLECGRKTEYPEELHTDIQTQHSSAAVQLSVLLFLRCLAEETRAKAFEEKMATIKARHIKAVSKKLLKKARG
ncbi:centromere protein W isoform X1 [Scleropages formosus]|uniref:centromere protein W isoform X1 n=1 Tax=Scleropages formosus TaxID=113540 RepID=UPI000877F650|nr:centromere protein W isoform X1 [Scleropages formosus]